jgi:hypothetical protein
MREFADCKIFINIEELGSLQSTHLPHPELVEGRTMGMQFLALRVKPLKLQP